MNINNSVDSCNFILGIQVALKTLVSVVPFLLIFFDGAIGGQAPLPPPLRTSLLNTPLFARLVNLFSCFFLVLPCVTVTVFFCVCSWSDPSHGLTGIHPDELYALESVQEITDFLLIQANFSGFHNLSFLRNLQVIRGHVLDRCATQ